MNKADLQVPAPRAVSNPSSDQNEMVASSSSAAARLTEELDLNPPKIFVVLPAYNEQEALPLLLGRIGATFETMPNEYAIVVVDDGSKDDTQAIIKDFSLQLPIELVIHEVNQGLGMTIRDGLKTGAELASPRDIVISLDSDNTHPPELMPRMISLVNEGHDIVIASRFQRGARVVGVPWNRVLMSYGARLMFSTLFPIKGVRDYTCGFRAYRATVLQGAFQEHGEDFVSESGFSSMVDILLKMRNKSLLMGEVPLLLRYDNKGNESKMNVLRTVTKTLKLIGRRRLGRMD